MRLQNRTVILWLHRTGWLFLIWAASVLALGAIAYALKLIMRAAGFSD